MHNSVDENAELVRELDSWLAWHWRDGSPAQGQDLKAWGQLVAEAGWAAPSWPPGQGGRSLSTGQSRVVAAAFRQAGAPGASRDLYCIPSVMIRSEGTDYLKEKVLPGFITGATRFCLLYSEPGAGSDLASLRTRAARQGDHYVVNGQKVWSSGAAEADYGILVARTDDSRPKHAGLSMFILPMNLPGVMVRPINQISGDSRFCEVFLDDVELSADYRLGSEGEGWQLLRTALVVERRIMGESTGRGGRGAPGEAIGLIDLARRTGKISDSHARQKVAQGLAWRQLNQLNAERLKEVAQSAPAILSLVKLGMSRILHGEAALRTELLGAASMLDGDEHPVSANVNYETAMAYMTSIGGGTDQIQRNIVAEQVLGLPRETDPDRDVPFRESRIVRS